MRKSVLRLMAILLAFTLLATACGDDGDSTTGDTGDSGDSADSGDTGDSGDSADSGDSGDSGDATGIPDQFPAPVDPVKGGRLQMAMNDNIDCYSGLSYYGISWSLFYFMARGLYGYPDTVEQPASDTVEPHLAAELPTVSDDGLTYTVTLREGLTFPNGDPVTSADVKATFEYMLDPNIQCATGGPPSSGYYDVIAGVAEYSEALTADPAADAEISGIVAVDELTTEFTLTAEDGAFVRALAMGWSYIRPASTPHEILEVSPPYVGPYYISDYQVDQSLTVDRQEGWADNVAAGVPEGPDVNNIDGIDLEIGVPDDVQLGRLKDNTLDITYDGSAPTGADVPNVVNDPQYAGRVFSTPDAAVDYGVFRTDQEPFNNVMLRQAVNYAIDRTTLARILGGELVRSPWSEILSSNLMAGSADAAGEVYTFDPDKARELVEASGVETPIAVTLQHFSDAPGPETAAAIKENLDAVGFDVTLEGATASVHYGVLADPEAGWDLGIAAWGQDFADAITFYGPLLTCGVGSNYGNFCDEDFDAAVAEIATMPAGPERAQAFAELSTQTMTDLAPWYPWVNRRKISFVSERVGNYIWGPGKQFYFANYFINE
ncbi:MAG: ABC transporter substrate-binding protein [Acidimicrobiales bacterium]